MFGVVHQGPLNQRDSKKKEPQSCVGVIGEAVLYHESGQWIMVGCAGEGVDHGDKATYGAITGMKKYGYSMVLGLPTTSDPEMMGSKPASKGLAGAAPPIAKQVERAKTAVSAADADMLDKFEREVRSRPWPEDRKNEVLAEIREKRNELRKGV
jgi:hypothetical protein